MGENGGGPETGKWDKLKSWGKVQEDIDERLKNAEKYDDSITLYYGPQLYHTFRHSAYIKCMTHFTSNVGEVFVSHNRIGTQDHFSVWTLDSLERGAKYEHQRFNINGEIKAFLFVPKHRVYMCFCSDLVMRIYTDVHSNCTETSSQQCLTTVRCMAYNRETDEVYVGGIGVLQKWKISGSEHSASAEPGQMFNTEIGKDEWVIDIKIDTRNKQLMAVTYEGIFVVNYVTMKQTHHLQNRHENSLRCCCFYKDREYFITGGGDGSVKVWNAVVFTQVHVFYGHHDVITGLQTHKTDPLLFSSSLDGSVQIWRMDNFTKFMRLDLAEKIYNLKLLADDEFYCQTENQIRIYSLNQFYSLFAPVESSVYKLQLCPGFKGQPNRIIASTEDGSVRLFSPITGATLTIIYPMPTFQVLSSFAYGHEMNRLHTVLQNGEVLVFNCDTNPCKAVELWKPETTDEEVLQIVQFTLGYDKEGESVTDTVILGGLRNGQICLLDASECVMVKNIQAHEGNITCMENSTDIGETGFKLLETSTKMATGGADLYIKIWELGVKAGRLYDNIVIQLLVKIPCTGMPEHISMYENTVSVSTCEDSDKGKLHMYRLDGHGGKEIDYTTLQHPQDEDHTEHITAIDKCPFLGLFATASIDGYIKVWNRHNQLIREMSFGEPMHGLSFANVRGDLLIGFQNHICTIPLTSYFPKSYLERINKLEFKDEYREYPVKYNHSIKASFDPRALPQYSVSFEKRTEEKKVREEEAVLEDLEATPWEQDIIVEQDEEEIDEEDFVELPAVTIESPSPRGKTDNLKHRIRRERRRSRVERDGLKEELIDQEIERGYSAPVHTPVKKMKMEKMREERRKSEELYLAKLSPWERDLFHRKPRPIIATDGYIPNSVVRKSLGYKPPPTPTRKQKDTWTIESIKLPQPEKPVHRTQSQDEEDDHWEEVKARYLRFLNESSEDSDVEVEISVPPINRGRPNHGRARGKKREKVVDSDDADDLELDDSEAVEDADIFAEVDESELIRAGSRKKVKARYLQFLDESSEGEKSPSSSEDSDNEPTISKPPRQGGGGRPQNAGRGRGKKKVRVVDSDDEDLDFDDSEPVEDTDIFPPGYEYEISKGLAGGPMSLLPADSDMKGFKPFNWGDYEEVEEGRKSSSYTPWRKMQSMIRTTSTLSNKSTSSSKRGIIGSRRSTPTTPKYELKSKKFDFHRVDLDLNTPERMKRSVGTRSRERTKSSFRLTNMVVDEQSTSVTFKDGKSGHRKGMLPAVDMDVIRHLMEEDFFPELHGTASFDSIMQNLIRLLDTEDSDLHAVVCDYIVNIHRDIGIPDHYLDRIITKLTSQLSGENSSLKRKVLHTLKEIGGDRQDVLATILPRLLDSQEDIREMAKEALAALHGVDNKDELLDLMNSLGMTKPFDSKEDEEEALKALAMRLDVPFRSDSFNDWINNWVDDASSIYDSEPEIQFDDVEKAWDGRQHKWKHESLCLTESASRASTRLRELSFLSKGSPVRGVSDLSGTVSIFDDYPSEFSQSDGETSQSDFYHSAMETHAPDNGNKELNENVQDGDVNDVVQDYDPDYTKKMLLEDLLKEYSDIRESDFEHDDENSENEMKMPRKVGGSKSFDSKKKSGSDDEIIERVIENKVVLNRYDSPDGSYIGNSVQNVDDIEVETSEKLNADTPKDLDISAAVGGTPIPEEEENQKGDLKIEDLDRLKTDGQLSDRSSRSGRRNRYRLSDENEALGLPQQGFLARDEPILHQGLNLEQKEGTTYSAEEQDRFDPRDPSLYRYYKNRYIRDKDVTDGKFNYKNMSKLFSKSQLGGGGEDADSQIGSLDSHSQVGDALSTNDSGIISIQDSGIGRDMSDSYSYKSYKASPFLSKEKVHTKVSTYKPRVDSHRRSNLSPVKSSSTIGGLSAKSSPREDADWMKFFQTPTALERKRIEMVKKDFHEGRMKPVSAAVINYISEGLPTLPGEAGLRLLKSVRVCGDKGASLEKQHRIESIPGKLGVHTKMEDRGQSKFGILQMQWTTEVPVPVSHNTYSERYSSMSDATSTLGGSGTINTYRSLPAIVGKYGNLDGTNASQILDDSDFPHAHAGIKSPDYRWDYPIPPPPAKESRISVPYIKKEHDRYCKYYSVVKKKVQSLSKKKDPGGKQLLPTVDIKKALPERLKLPKELTKLSRVSSVLFPPITLNQLISAR